MNELLEFIEDLRTLEVLDTVSKEAHIELLIEKYETKFSEVEKDMEAQYEMFGN